MDLIEFLNNDGLDELEATLGATEAELGLRVSLNYPGHMAAEVTTADAMKFLHMFSKRGDGKYSITAKNQEELDFLKQSWNWIDSDQFQIGAEYDVRELGIFIASK